ncbi:MAG: acyl-ACP--UDP-N-acetylglucosamine O-acyltransferase [Opitutaceae bacterium]|nr:acyl-ACP--UDP-N-acetylglucosamine O-acyltransferase [Opitutaceae bacterium]
MVQGVPASAIVENGVTLGAGVTLMPGAILRTGTDLGDGVTVHSYAVIAGEPQDLRFDPKTVSGVKVGARSTLREFVTINRATKPGHCTHVGQECFLMAGAHLAHDVRLGDFVILANNVLLAGHVTVGERTFIGGGAAVHQFCRIGEGAMVAGLARITLDVAPFTMVAERDEVIGLNLVGLKRRSLPRLTIQELKELFRQVYFTPGNIRTVAAEALASRATWAPESLRFLEFFAGGKRGFARPRRGSNAEAEADSSP